MRRTRRAAESRETFRLWSSGNSREGDYGCCPSRRYFGLGDVLKNATLDFEAGARVQIGSLFEKCIINLGAGTELVVGEAGVLADCTISGAGSITVHGQFFERQSPGIVGPRELVVTKTGAVAASVVQNEALTRFAFERESRLRLKILKSDAKGG